MCHVFTLDYRSEELDVYARLLCAVRRVGALSGNLHPPMCTAGRRACMSECIASDVVEVSTVSAHWGYNHDDAFSSGG